MADDRVVSRRRRLTGQRRGEDRSRCRRNHPRSTLPKSPCVMRGVASGARVRHAHRVEVAAGGIAVVAAVALVVDVKAVDAGGGTPVAALTSRRRPSSPRTLTVPAAVLPLVGASVAWDGGADVIVRCRTGARGWRIVMMENSMSTSWTLHSRFQDDRDLRACLWKPPGMELRRRRPGRSHQIRMGVISDRAARAGVEADDTSALEIGLILFVAPVAEVEKSEPQVGVPPRAGREGRARPGDSTKTSTGVPATRLSGSRFFGSSRLFQVSGA